MSDSKQLIGTAPYFVVRDLLKSVDYYHEALGFERPKLWGDPPEFAMPKRDGFIFMLKQADDGQTITTNRDQNGYWDAYVWVTDVEGLFGEFRENGAEIDYEPKVMSDYDMVEFAIKDPDGYVIAFGQHHEG